jgi:hypothetical protein
MLSRIAFSAYYGVSEAVIERARRLLAFEIGSRRDGTPVTVAAMLVAADVDPQDWAQWLMIVDPMAAVGKLTDMIGRFLIDGEPAPDPAAVARAALSHAGRVVTWREAHPEVDFLQGLVRVVAGWLGLGG